jgi:hypothetical protein
MLSILLEHILFRNIRNAKVIATSISTNLLSCDKKYNDFW